MKSLLSPLALLAALVMTLSGCARTIPPPTSAESASPSAPTVETSDEKPDKLPDDSQSESTAQLTEAAASPQLCAYLPVSSLPEDAAAALEPYRQSISSLDYLILNTGVYWAADGTLEVSPAFSQTAKLLSGQTKLWATVNPKGALVREGSAGSSIATEQQRQTLCQNILKLCREYSLDGIDIDWEFPQEEEWESFSLLLVQLKQLLSSQPQPIALSVALYPQQNQLNAEAMQALDRIHLMAYDQFDQQGFHSTLQTAQEAVEQLLQQGADARQLSLGIPAYGRPLDASAQWVFYKDIPQDISRENPDLDGEIFFNSAATAVAKTQFACDSKLGGVMLYHLLCDRTDEDSLIAACRTAIDPK